MPRLPHLELPGSSIHMVRRHAIPIALSCGDPIDRWFAGS